MKKLITHLPQILIGIFLFFGAYGISGNSEQESYACKNLKKKPIQLGYKIFDVERYTPKTFTNLSLPPTYTISGKMLRAMRYENITKIIENRYCLPEGILMAMVMQETMGEDCLPNRSGSHKWGDGGFGICHIQGIVGEEYGLNTVCDETCGEASSKYKCYKHAKILGEAITYKDNCNPAKTFMRDDRLHPILNLDAVGRILARKEGTIREKVEFYRGGTTAQREKYWNRVRQYHLNLMSPWRRNKVMKEFNVMNPNLMIGGKKVENTYYDWLQTWHDQNMNFGLWEYASLGNCQSCCENLKK